MVLGDDTYADFSLSCFNITENKVEIFIETVEEMEETAKEVNEAAEEVNETDQVEKNVDKERQWNVKSLEEVVNKISSPQKQKVKQSFSKISRSFELTVCHASLAYLKSLWEKCAFPAFHKLLFDLLSNNPENDDFLKRLSKSLEIRTH